VAITMLAMDRKTAVIEKTQKNMRGDFRGMGWFLRWLGYVSFVINLFVKLRSVTR
jgi:hypothetical protein